MQCVTCGKQNPPEAKACSACGSPLGVGSGNGAYTPLLAQNTRLHNGAYAVGALLGQGGFGITYKGGDLSLRRYVAIKEFFLQGSIRQNTTVQPDRTVSPADYNKIKAGFIKEAHCLAQFSHPSIVRVFGVFEENNTAYMVMEYLEGQSLQQYITQKRSLSEAEVVDIAVKVGDALSVIHGAGLIHRDIKPDNIMRTNDGRIVLIDFGTARAFASDKTVKQTAMLTAGYAPLEQYGSHARFGPYTDIYALGATLYHALTGEVPPPATDLASGVELKAPNAINWLISPTVSNALMWAMKTKAADRPQSVQAFLESLKKKAPVVPSPAVPTPVVPSQLPRSYPIHPTLPQGNPQRVQPKAREKEPPSQATVWGGAWVVVAILIAVMSGFRGCSNTSNDPDVLFAKTAFTELADGDQSVQSSLDWEHLHGLGIDVGSQYNSLPNDEEKAAARRSFISSFSTGFRNSGASVDGLTNWRLEDAGNHIVAADAPNGRSLRLTISTPDGTKEISDIEKGN